MFRKFLLTGKFLLAFIVIIIAIYAHREEKNIRQYNKMALKYYQEGNYSQALDFYVKIISKRSFLVNGGISNQDIYDNMGKIYMQINDYHKALEYYTKVLNIREKNTGRYYFKIANSYNNISSVYIKMHNYSMALEFAKKAIDTQETFIEDIREAVRSYNNMGTIYRDMGDYTKASEFYTKALNIIEKNMVLFYDFDYFYNNLGIFYYNMGDYPKALEFYTKALKIVEHVFNKDHPGNTGIYNNIGSVYHAMGDYPKALEFYTKTLNIFEKVLGKDHPDTAASYNNIGSVYDNMGDYPKAIEFLTKALNIREKSLDKDHPNTAASYNNIGSVYDNMGDYPKAIEFLTKALNIREKSLGKDHPDTANSYNNIGFAYNKIGDYNKSYNYSKEAYYIFKLNRDKNFEILSNEQKKRFLEASRWYLPHLLTNGYSYQQTAKDKEALSQEIYEIFINDKGILLDDENTIAMLKNISQDKNLISKIDSLNSLKRAYAKLAGTMPKPEEAKSYQEKLKALGEDIEKAEIEIAKISPKFKQELGIKDLKLSDLTSLLKPNELFVDIGYYGKNYYIFSVDKSGEVKFEKLSNKDSDTVNTTIKEFRADIDKIINATDANSSKALKELYNIVIEKGIGDRMDKFNSLIISTDGALRLLPFEALMDGDKYLIEKKQIRYTPSAKEFIRTHKFNIKDEGKDITMFSDPNYESKSGKSMEMVADTPNVNKAVQTRSIKNMGTFKRLRGFKKEEEILQSSFNGVKLFSRENANEENILAVKSPKILHITTHGYFISDENITNPMLKSGVALSGANIGIKQQTGEGLVNALKLSGLSLDGTDLVVLSACETGLVDVKDTSSVASLPKTFIQAGSKNVLMSLWSVDDNSTVELMKEFYTDTKGNEKKFNEVLRNAKIKMIKEGKHPFYWAAFIMSGE